MQTLLAIASYILHGVWVYITFVFTDFPVDFIGLYDGYMRGVMRDPTRGIVNRVKPPAILYINMTIDAINFRGQASTLAWTFSQPDHSVCSS